MHTIGLYDLIYEISNSTLHTYVCMYVCIFLLDSLSLSLFLSLSLSTHTFIQQICKNKSKLPNSSMIFIMLQMIYFKLMLFLFKLSINEKTFSRKDIKCKS